MICSGNFSEPYLPAFPGQEDFTGEVLHTCQYRTSDPFKDKNILVIGTKKQFTDQFIKKHLKAKQVYLSSRHGFWVYPRRAMGGWPYDVLLDNRFSMSVVPGWLIRWVYQQFLERDIDYDVIGIKPARKLFEENFAVNDSIFSQITCGKIKVRSGVKRFIRNGVEFEDGTKLEGIDVVLIGTGYIVKTPFIDDKILSDDTNTRELYKYVFPARLPHATLACIGLMGTDSGLTPIGEQQARWSLRVFKGHITLPPTQKMLDDISEKAQYLRERYGRPKDFVSQIPGVALTDELTSEMGCYPSLKKLFVTDPKLAAKVLFAPVTPFTYRLLGPHSWSGARDAVTNVWDACMTGIQGKPSVMRQTKSKSSALWIVMISLPFIIGILTFFF
ncbi:Dimethylaniline monooxygenase [N-oxide-forming] 2 [Holothuria leucospilota]|uniref:Flavin-containing monooxygenase n=1 Tax=Holothuria leucospilota TaxID=206669 RepID=A0A9Q1HAX7_HOLLE|nr:Dimethylaniline monooxygenase [N-oxide-forming] 2 [Holothuria leucospilota]